MWRIIVVDSSSDHEKLLKIRDSLKVLERELKRDAQSLISLISNVSLLQARFLQEGILFRGGLAYGDMYHRENLCFGPAFNRAYYLENKVAKYPRIVIDNDIVTGKAQPTDWTDDEKFEFEALFQSEIDTFNPFGFKDKDLEGNDLHYVNFMLLNTFRSSKTKILEIFNEQKQSLNRKDEDQEKIYLKLDWLTSTIEKHMKAFEIKDAKIKEFMRKIARDQGL